MTWNIDYSAGGNSLHHYRVEAKVGEAPPRAGRVESMDPEDDQPITATQLGDSPFVLLEWTRTNLPDSWIIRREPRPSWWRRLLARLGWSL